MPPANQEWCEADACPAAVCGGPHEIWRNPGTDDLLTVRAGQPHPVPGFTVPVTGPRQQGISPAHLAGLAGMKEEGLAAATVAHHPDCRPEHPHGRIACLAPDCLCPVPRQDAPIRPQAGLEQLVSHVRVAAVPRGATLVVSVRGNPTELECRHIQDAFATIPGLAGVVIDRRDCITGITAVVQENEQEAL